MTTETINGLHRCQPKNQPQPGQTKTFLVIRNPARNGKKPWIAIKSATADKGGTPYKVVSVEPTGWEPDDYGNVSMNLEIETMNLQQGEEYSDPNPLLRHANLPSDEDGVAETRKRLMRVVNLYNLCIRAVELAVSPDLVRTGEQYQSTLASFWIYMSSRRSDDGITWWDYTDKMPDKPL